MLNYKIQLYVGCLLLAFLFLLLFSWATSPLYENYGVDSTVFMYVGKGLLSAYIPYIDIFDHKGPLLYFVQALGQWVWTGRIGAFIVQVLNMSIILFFVFQIAHLFNMKNKILLILSTLLVLAYPLSGGNLTEEYSLPFSLVCVFLAIRFCLCSSPQHPLYYSFVYGIATASIVLTRASNLGPVIGVVGTIAFILLFRKQYGALFMNAVAWIVGILFVVLPITAFFMYHGGLMEMLEGTFGFNFKYINDSYPFGKGFVFSVLCLVFNLAALLFYNQIHKNKELFYLLLVSLVITFISVNIGRKYNHYQMTFAACTVVGIIQMISVLEYYRPRFRYNYLKWTGCIWGMAFLLLFSSRYYHALKDDDRVFQQNKLQLINDVIPSSDRNSVFFWNIPLSLMYQAQIYPYFKYSIGGDSWVKTDLSIMDKLFKKMDTILPQWVIVPDEISSNVRLQEIIMKNYIEMGARDGLVIYKYSNGIK